METKDFGARARRWLAISGEVLGTAASRFRGDQCLRIAASLSYTSLLAAVPLSAIAFAILSAFPVFDGVREKVYDILFANFLPQAAESLRDHFDLFVRNTTTLSAIGIVALALTAVLLLWTIEMALNTVFHVTQTRHPGPRLLMFWSVITLGPLLLGASFSLSAYFFAASQWLGIDPAAGFFGDAAKLLPTAIMFVLLTLFYMVIPNRPVAVAGAVPGALVAGLLIGLLRRGFGIYVVSFPTYQNIYGALSTVPIFLIWMYLSWAAVLFGGEIAATITEWREAGGRPLRLARTSISRLSIAIAVLARLNGRAREGGSVRRRELTRAAQTSSAVLEPLLEDLRAAGYVERTSANTWVLARDLDTVSLHRLYRDLGLGVADDAEALGQAGWQGNLTRHLADLRRRNAEAMGLSLADLLAEPEAAAEKPALKQVP